MQNMHHYVHTDKVGVDTKSVDTIHTGEGPFRLKYTDKK